MIQREEARISVPFYNHQYNTNDTGESVGLVFRAIGSKITELPCLCQYPLPHNIQDRPVAIIHGARFEDTECYRKISEQITANPQTLFYLWAINFDLDEMSHEFFNNKMRPINCKLITGKNAADVVLEVKGIFRERKNNFQRM